MLTHFGRVYRWHLNLHLEFRLLLFLALCDIDSWRPGSNTFGLKRDLKARVSRKDCES